MDTQTKQAKYMREWTMCGSTRPAGTSLTLSARITYMYVMVHVTGPRITYIYVMRTVKMNVLPRHPWSTDLIPTWTSDVLDERRLFYDSTDGRTCAAMHAY